MKGRESALKKVRALIKQFNETFTIEADIAPVNNVDTVDTTDAIDAIETDETNENVLNPIDRDEVVNTLHITGLKNDGSAFLDEIFDTLTNMVHIASDEHELVFTPDKGFALAKKKIIYEPDIDE